MVPTDLPPFHRPCSRFSLDCGGLVVGVEEISLVEEIVPVPLFVDDYDLVLYISSVLVSRYYLGVLTLNQWGCLTC